MQQSNQTPAQYLSSRMREAFERTFPDAVPFPDLTVSIATRPEFGDYQCNYAMALAKKLGRPPRQTADQVIANARMEDIAHPLEVAGPGFINIRLRDEWCLETATLIASTPNLGVPRCGAGRTVVLDYSSPNVAKPMHIGHIRSTIIGNALDRLHRFLGYNVISDNHLGDWGTQFGILIMGYRHFLDREALESDPVGELERVYVKSYARSEEDPAWLDQCRLELVKLQEGHPDNLELWRKFVKVSLEEFQRIYERLGVKFDLVRGESHYHAMLPDVIERLAREGLARESEGALVVFLDDEKLPPCIVRKSDGAFNYAATDIATVISRVNEFKPDRIIYVTDERQQLHFKQVFAICRKLGLKTDLEHVWFGLMRLPEGTFSTRQGNVIKLEKLLDEAEARALAIVKENSPDMPPERQRQIAKAVGIGAVKYADLSQNPQTTVVFTWEKALSLEGNSGPYLQYAYARIASVRDKYAERFQRTDPESFPIRITEPVERALVMALLRFPDSVMNAAHQYKPSILADYLYELSQTYSAFYQNVPFLKAEEGIRESRVRLCGMVAAVLGKGLNLLGIETPERI